MPSLSAAELIRAVCNSAFESGGSAVLVSPPREHPRVFAVTKSNGESTQVWVYIWTLTPGGREIRGEYRVQLTGIEPPIQNNPNGPTVLLGFDPNLGVFAGFDLEKHRTFSKKSPSVQVGLQALQDAQQHGLGFYRKANDEVVVGFRGDRLFDYLALHSQLHANGNRAMVDLLERASSLEVSAKEVEALAPGRKRIVKMVARLSRQANFRQQVLDAYGHRCAISRTQLRLVEAAHILPVEAPGSVDDVRNGLALAPTYHRAYDSGLIVLDEDYRFRVSRSRESELAALSRDGGLAAFRDALGEGKILLPQDRAQWPRPEYITKAKRFRKTGA